jgi:hypothetical protein
VPTKQNKHMTNLVFTNRSQAVKQTKLSYLGGVSLSQKIKKNTKKNVLTYIIYLAPADLSGYNVCPKHTIECKKACLSESGHNRIDIHNVINTARINKTKLFFQNRAFFNSWLYAEIVAYKLQAENKGMEFAVRFNGTSDIDPTLFVYNGKTFFELFPNTQMYDYTKVIKRFDLVKEYSNYDLTYSFSGKNWVECETALSKGIRVAVVFEKELPKKYKGYPVINGDLTDLRFLDPKNVIVGLKYKKVRNKIDLSKNKFIISKDDKDCEW